MALTSTLLLLSLAYATWSVISFARNYRTARKIGLPIIVSPIDALNPFWYFASNIVCAVFLKLPSGMGGWAHRVRGNWTNQARYSMHARYGPAFAEVTPVSVKVFVADAEALEDIFKRHNDFIKSPFIYMAVEVFGRNLDSVNGADWARHRRITVPPFNEKNSALVWRESMDQANNMLASWQDQDIVESTATDNSALALNVLCLAGFGRESRFIDARAAATATAKNGSERLGYRQALRTILSSFGQLLLVTTLTKIGIPSWWLRGKAKQVDQARTEFKSYMTEMITDERKHYEAGNLDRHNLIAALIRADITAKKESDLTMADNSDKNPATSISRGLSEEEIFGNLFFYNLGGHETTASTITFALILLALHPEIQAWIGTEVDSVFATSSPSYETTFPRLQRVLAVMHETLRLYGPVPTNPRETRGDAPTSLPIQGHTHVLPPGTTVIGVFAAVHSNPTIWGADALDFRPERFIIEGTDTTNEKTPQAYEANEKFKESVHDAGSGFVAWNRGPRICPGRKFSQVEFVAVLSVLFARGSRVELVRLPGEDRAAAERRARKALFDAELEIALKIAEDVPLRWVRGGRGDGGVVGGS